MAKGSMMWPQTFAIKMYISPVSELTEVWSPAVYIHGIAWEIEARKDEDENSLAIFLHRGKQGHLSNLAVSACATVKLLSFKQKKNVKKSPLVHHIQPNVFDSSGCSYGTSELIKWDELFTSEKRYVSKDRIEISIEITAENPDHPNRSILKLETINKSDDGGTFRLLVKNVENLVAVRTSQFDLHGLPWNMTVYKCQQTSALGIKLSNDSSQNLSCKIEMSVKLLSSQNDMDPIKQSDTVDGSTSLKINEIISWNGMLRRKNGYFNDKTITLEVKIKAEKPEGANADRNNNAAKRRRLECSICFAEMDKQDISITSCGHLFCTTCITNTVNNSKSCPTCNATVNSLQRAHLPFSNSN